MKNKFIDTNIFIEIAVRSDEKNAIKCLNFVKKNKNLWTTSWVIAEIEWILRSFYKIKKDKIIEVLWIIMGLDIDIADRKLIEEAMVIFEKNNIDFTDCINCVLMSKNEVTEVVSYDHDFDKIKSLKRLEP